MKKSQLKILIKEIICEELNKWGGYLVKNKEGKVATVSIWKLPPNEYHARIDFPDATVYVDTKYTKKLRRAHSKEELYPFIRQELEKRGFDSKGIENTKVLLSISAWKNPLKMMSQPEYNLQHHLAQSKFQQKLQKIVGDIKYRLSHPEEFDDK
jgi:hypothetical protein